MTQPPPTRPPADRELARDIAREIDHRRMRRRLTLWAVLLALVAAGALYLRCGGGFGLLGIGGAGQGGTPGTLVGPQRCAVHVSAGGMTVDRKAMARDEAVAICKAAPGVDVFPTGDARHGDVEGLRAALEAAGAKAVVVHPPPRAPRPASPPPRN